jgi:hypothetical protein
LEDFDFLIQTIKETFPSLHVKKVVEKNDIIQNLENLRKEITPQMTTGEFYILLEKAGQTCQNPHMGMGVRIDTKNKKIQKNKQDFNVYTSGFQRFVYLDLELCYNKGNYYTTIPFVKGDIVYPHGLQLVHLNGIDIHEQVQKQIPYRILKWDKENRRYYLTDFYQSSYFVDKPLHFEFTDSNETVYQLTTSLQDKVEFTEKIVSDQIKVAKLLQDSIYYIKLRSMRYDKAFLERLDKDTCKDNVKYLILDVRGNGGGTDYTWHNIVNRCYDTAICNYLAICIKNTDLLMKELKRQNNARSFIRKVLEIPPTQITLLGNDTMKEIKECSQIEKAEYQFKNIKKIFVFTDDGCFSSTLVLTKFALQEDKIISIGTSAAWIGGSALEPQIFYLPHSKLSFTSEITIDLYDVKTLEDLYISVEHTLDLTPAYYHLIKSKLWEYEYDFLKNNDPYFQWVLDYIQQQ